MATEFPCLAVRLHDVLVRGWPGETRSAIDLEATRRLGVSASDTWFIGDGQDNELAGAERAGLRSFQALWFLKRWPHFREPPGSASTLSHVENSRLWSNNPSHPWTAPPGTEKHNG